MCAGFKLRSVEDFRLRRRGSWLIRGIQDYPYLLRGISETMYTG